MMYGKLLKNKQIKLVEAAGIAMPPYIEST